MSAMNRVINFEEFLEIVCSKMGDAQSRDGLTRLFQIWDIKSWGFIDLYSCKSMAISLGETLNDDELTKIMHNAFFMNNIESHDNFSFEEF